MRATLAALLLALGGGAGAQGYQAGTEFSADAVRAQPDLKKIGIEQRLGQRVQTLAEFTDDQGKRVRLGDLLGERPVLLLPIFYNCVGVCNLELTGVVDALAAAPDLRVGRDLDVVALGIHPKETWELARAKKALTLRTFAGKTDPKGWRFLTGDPESVRAVTDSLGFLWSYDAERDRVSHPAGIMTITPRGVISSYLLGAKFSPSQLRSFLAVARREEVGQKSREILLGCVHIDPVTGERSIVIERVLKVLGVATVLAMLSGFAVLNGRRWWGRRTA